MPVRFIFDADSAIFPSGSFAELKQITSGSMQRRVLAFDDTNVERCFFMSTAPSGWSGSIGACIVGFPNSATSGSVVWELSVDARASGCTMDASSFGATASALVGLTAASNLSVAVINPDDDSAAAGKHLTFLLRRVTTSASDDATGDMFFQNLIVADGR